MKCDIIIPIYNAYDCLEPCIDSVIKNTDLKNNRIILINDQSTDKRVILLLKKYERENKSIILLENKQNLGFVGTVNKGMQYSDNDVLLLNSDTEVTPRWLENIKKTAYGEPKVATVTALSNNATLASVPKGLQPNNLPDFMSLDEYANLIAKIGYDESFEIPTAHGFCMYIRREVLNLVGYFDEEKFGKGYGEENDFSFRCLDYGYKNLLCTRAFVYHKESQSFSSKKEQLIKENSKKLEDSYPIYKRRIELWCQNFPIGKVCENIDYQVQLHNRKNILILIHDWNDVKNHVGGTTLHVYDLINHLREKYNFHILAPSNGIYKLFSYFKNEEKITKFSSINSCNIIPIYSEKYKKMVDSIIKGFRIDTLHIHHMIGHYFDIIDVAKENKIQTMITLHDFYCLCPTINMLYKMERYCPRVKNKKCSECISCKTGLKNNVIDTWHLDWKIFLSKFDKIIVPSKDTKKQIQTIYKDLSIDVIEHGIDLNQSDYISNIENVKTYNIAFVGVMPVHKGGKILQQLIKKCAGSNIVFHLFGVSEIDGLNKTCKNYVYHGRYKKEDLPKLLSENKINLVCSFSICAETYSYTLTESIASGVPVLAFDVGAVQDRIRENKLGWIIPLDSDIDYIYDEINKIFNKKDEYRQIIDNIKKYHIKTINAMAKDYQAIYDKSKITELDDNNSNILRSILEANYEVKESINSAETAWILNSLKWRLVSKIKVPESIKKIVKKVMK